MHDVADQSAAPTTIGADLCAIFISLELSRSTWLATSLSPGRGEKMSKHSVPAGDIAALLARFSELRRKACARTGKSFPIVVIQEAGLDGFWIHRVLLSEGIESHVVDAASIATASPPAASRPRPTGSSARLCFARCSPTSAANRGSVRWFGHRRLKMKTAAGFAVSARC